MLQICKIYIKLNNKTFHSVPHILSNLNIFNLLNKVMFCSEKVNMNILELFVPPKTVNKMKILNRDAFKQEVIVSCLEVKKQDLGILSKVLKNYFLNNVKVKPIQSVEDSTKLKIILNPNIIKSFDDFNDDAKKSLSKLEITEKSFSKTVLVLTYECWPAKTLLKAVLPENEPPLSSYSVIGHIIHLNIKDHLLEYKNVIAQILLDKIPFAKTVVFKKSIISNVFRTFEMEVLCGEPNFIASTTEYGVKFEFDFSKVYWNPRLSTEHDRIVQYLGEGDALFDIFAGVGPFSIRAAKKKCLVFANDLNPDAFFWLNHNINLNKKAKDFIKTYNKDGADFILSDVKFNLIKLWNDKNFSKTIHFVMNLPASALKFLKYFKSLITEKDLLEVDVLKIEKCLPIIHCHYFIKEPETEYEVFKRDSQIYFHLDEQTFHFVRKVSNKKTMIRSTFKLPLKYILQEELEESGPPSKKLCKQ